MDAFPTTITLSHTCFHSESTTFLTLSSLPSSFLSDTPGYTFSLTFTFTFTNTCLHIIYVGLTISPIRIRRLYTHLNTLALHSPTLFFSFSTSNGLI